MTNALTLLTAFFLVLIIYLINKIQVDRQKFRSRVATLESFIIQLNKEQQLRHDQIQLSAELKEKLHHINVTLHHEIYELNIGLIEELYPKK